MILRHAFIESVRSKLVRGDLMRLTEYEVKVIRETIQLWDESAKVFLFGSRIDEDKKGGDIDLLIMSHKLDQSDIYKIKTNLWERLGEQQIDIIIAEDSSHPFTRIALKEGIQIC